MQPHKEMTAGLLVYIFIAALMANTALIVIDMFKGVY